VDLRLDRVGGCPRRRLERRQSHAALRRRVHAVPRSALARGSGDDRAGSVRRQRRRDRGARLERASSGRADLFLDGRLSYPTGYPNANAAFFLSAFWVALVLATRRTVPVPLRVAAAMAAALLPQAALLSQSRATLVAFPATAIVLIVALPGRVRTAVGVIATIVLVAVTWETHVSVFDAAQEGRRALESAIADASAVIAVAVVVAAVASLAWAVVDRRMTLSERQTRVLERSALAAAQSSPSRRRGVIALHPVERPRAAGTFTAVAVTDTTAHFSLGLGSNRYDFWRVAMSRFEARPLTGVGADNFAVDYLKERRSIEEPTYPHSLQVMVLSQLGLVGGALMLVFLAAAGTAALPRRREDPAATALAGAALAGCVYFFLHASVDWFWEIPALGAPAVALSAWLCPCGRAPERRSHVEPPGTRHGARARGRRSGVAAVSRARSRGSRTGRWTAPVAVWRRPPSRPTTTSSGRGRSIRSAESRIVAGAIAARRDDRARMRSLFARSLERNPYSWYAQLELGLTESVSGRRQAALAAVRRAVALNPQEPLLQEVLGRLEQGERISPRSLDAVFVDRISPIGGQIGPSRGFDVLPMSAH
jgi:hypothetical protein